MIFEKKLRIDAAKRLIALGLPQVSIDNFIRDINKIPDVSLIDKKELNLKALNSETIKREILLGVARTMPLSEIFAVLEVYSMADFREAFVSLMEANKKMHEYLKVDQKQMLFNKMSSELVKTLSSDRYKVLLDERKAKSEAWSNAEGHKKELACLLANFLKSIPKPIAEVKRGGQVMMLSLSDQKVEQVGFFVRGPINSDEARIASQIYYEELTEDELSLLSNTLLDSDTLKAIGKFWGMQHQVIEMMRVFIESSIVQNIQSMLPGFKPLK